MSPSHTMCRIAALGAALSIAAACGRALPTAPGAPSPGTGLTLACSTAASLAGDIVVCLLRSGLVNVSFDAAWSSSEQAVATSEGFGLFIGKTDGQTMLTATYAGKTMSAPLTVRLEDVIRATAAAYQGTFRVGTTATFTLQGFYGVASADAGTLTLVVTDQTGATISASAPLTVPRGGDRYILSTTFTLPPGATRVCRAGVLQIGATILTVVPAAGLVPCVDVTP